MLKKDCGVCDHPERAALEEALDRGDPYKALTKQFKVSIGSMKRHRRGHMSSDRGSDPAQDEETMSATGEPVYLRFGELPEGGRSYNYLEGFEEDGVSVFSGRRGRRGYAFDVPTELECAGRITGVVDLMLCRRALYLASGTEIGQGSDGEPLLEDVTLKPVPLYARVELPHWLGEAGKRFSERWCKHRRNSGGNYSVALEEAAAQVLVASARVFYDLYGDLYDEWRSPEEFEAAALEKAQRDIRKGRRV